MSGCDKCGMSGIGLATYGHGSPCTPDKDKEIAKLRAALEPFANVARQIRSQAGTDTRWLETPLFHMGDLEDPGKWTLTGKAFDAARAAVDKQ